MSDAPPATPRWTRGARQTETEWSRDGSVSGAWRDGDGSRMDCECLRGGFVTVPGLSGGERTVTEVRPRSGSGAASGMVADGPETALSGLIKDFVIFLTIPLDTPAGRCIMGREIIHSVM